MSKLDAEINNKLTEELKKIINNCQYVNEYQYIDAVLKARYVLDNFGDFAVTLALDITIAK